MKPTADKLLETIRAYCLECSGGSRKEVERCPIKYCKLRPYRSIKAMNHVVSNSKTTDIVQIGMFEMREAQE